MNKKTSLLYGLPILIIAVGYFIITSLPGMLKTSPEGITKNAVPTHNINNQKEKANLIILESPKPGQIVNSPLIVEGQARGSWFFEANFPITLQDASGREVASGVATALDEWMTEDFVPFTATIKFIKPSTKQGNIVLHKANASDLEDKDDSLVV
ncbi:hypothetical protein GYA27_04235, partial [candidate division WWE3 bacterium]|nr:hypothetical protein [candidate division WWE3 bacterium]